MSDEQTKYEKNIFIFLSKKIQISFIDLNDDICWRPPVAYDHSVFQWNRGKTKWNERKGKERNKENFYNWNISESKMTMFVRFEFSVISIFLIAILNRKKSLRINQYVLVIRCCWSGQSVCLYRCIRKRKRIKFERESIPN